jgi:hypothetical protein
MKALFKWENGCQEYHEVPSYPPPVMQIPLIENPVGPIKEVVLILEPMYRIVKFLRVNHNDGSFEYREFIQ